MRWKVFAIRIVLGVVFAVVLNRLFFPPVGWVAVLLTAGFLVLLAYGLEIVRRGRDR